MYEYFTTEDYLIDSLSLFGPTTTTLLVTTPLMQFYGGGVFYKREDCSDYLLEDVPEVCQEFRAGRLAYTCLKVIYPLARLHLTFLSRLGKQIVPSYFRTVVAFFSIRQPWHKKASMDTLLRRWPMERTVPQGINSGSCKTAGGRRGGREATSGWPGDSVTAPWAHSSRCPIVAVDQRQWLYTNHYAMKNCEVWETQNPAQNV